MKNPLADTLTQLNDHPAVNKAAGIGEERELITTMIQEMIDNPDALDGFNALDVAEHILGCIQRDYHRRNFDA